MWNQQTIQRSSQQNCCNMDCCVFRCVSQNGLPWARWVPKVKQTHQPDKNTAQSSPKSKEKKIIYNNYKMAKRNGVKYISLFCPFHSYFVRVHGRYGHSFAGVVTRIQIRLRSIVDDIFLFFSKTFFGSFWCRVTMSGIAHFPHKKNAHVLHV